MKLLLKDLRFANDLKDYQSCASTAPMDISARIYEFAEEASTLAPISIDSSEGQQIYAALCSIYTRYADIRLDENTHNYYAADEPAWLIGVRFFAESLQEHTQISSTSLLYYLADYWPDVMWISEVYTILITLLSLQCISTIKLI